MQDQTAAATEPDGQSETEASGRAIPLPIRLLGTAAVAALIVGLFALIQLSSSEEDPIVPADIGLGQQIRPLAGGDPPGPGMPAPDFTVPTLDGGSFSLSRHLADDGRPVLVNMWAEWCFPCREEMPAIDAAARRHPEVHFIGVVVMDREEPARKFIAKYGITYQIGMDDRGQVEDRYFVWVMPTTYLIDGDGVIVERVFGPMDESDLEDLVSTLGAAVD